MAVCGGYWLLWMMEKVLGMLEMVLEERRRRNGVFPILIGLQGSKRTSD